MNILDNVLGYSLDDEQRSVIYNNSKNTLVVAGAGSGKTLTIIGKIRYLIEEVGYLESEILVISFTRETVNSLKGKLLENYNYNIEVCTFHKLALNILSLGNIEFRIAPSDFLEYFIEEYFDVIIRESFLEMNLVVSYFYPFSFRDNGLLYEKLKSDKNKEFKIFKDTICNFIHLFKERGYDYSKFLEFLRMNRNRFGFTKRRFRLFLKITFNIYHRYQEELKSSNMIDFSDMLLMAIDFIKDNKPSLGIKYIIVDEYQDSSYLRFSLIKEIEKISNCNLLAVGDDFQSIYRFTGCNLDMFLNFEKLFDDTRILKITNTYRNSQELIDIAYDFIRKNPMQIRKNLKSSKHQVNPIRIIKTSSQIKEVKNILNNLNDIDVLILGRNNFDKDKILDSELIEEDDRLIYLNNKSLDIRYLTVHRSKGLEASIVILINVNHELYGFPSGVRSDRLLKYVLDNKEYYKDEEERRLFYVALTRTKSIVYVICDKSKVSPFVKEIERIM